MSCSMREGYFTWIKRTTVGQAMEIKGLGPLYSLRYSWIAKLTSPHVGERSQASSNPRFIKPGNIFLGNISFPNCACSPGEGRATVCRNFVNPPKGSVKGTMALFGHAVIHSPQSMHFSSMIIAFPFLILMAWVGQTRKHFMRLLHFSVSIRME